VGTSNMFRSFWLRGTGYDIMIYSIRLGLSCEQPPQGNPSHMWIVIPLMLGNYCPSHAIWVVKTITQKEMDELTYVNLENSNLRSTRWYPPIFIHCHLSRFFCATSWVCWHQHADFVSWTLGLRNTRATQLQQVAPFIYKCPWSEGKNGPSP
jgi:hypothetical protein